MSNAIAKHVLNNEEPEKMSPELFAKVQADVEEKMIQNLVEP